MNTLDRSTPHKEIPKEQKLLLERTVSIASTAIMQMAKDRVLSRASGMNDTELMQFIFEKILENNTLLSERELRRIHRLNEGTRAFTEQLKEQGGTIKAGDVAKRLKTSRQTVNNKLKANKLLAVRPGNDYLFPEFQFSGTKVVDGFEEILSCLGDDLGSVSKVSFFTNMYFFGEDGPNVITAMKSDNAKDYWEEIKHQASIFGRHIS
ncbi:TPA: helix-turn-helix domain-containing protein [Salmonella enterica]|uniref:helix-turn-helix domain-containing protein n=1 Tax=Salmonella enterica TaxID=28901 RepID=UPI0012718F76|nr:helix-turn-helix domain-containing protein [Salmonella enterica]EBG7016756.1 helix-turn-helix domain-containing protein [Salmonella enterica subsp. enterica serovar Heidelberg]EBG9324096.1 helix-turn-helix domain-containing protein [Salmonella enterica subsp. enterica serovar Saintpaul]EBS6505665.1 DNA-binding protein [Salmonella enterica subsp. enterica serovar Infantis]ECD6690039.1 DNA-binding protein [Salmonella enterica subsp. enterica serovar Eastbourne]EDD2829877.1 DNA-binding protein